MQIFSDSIFISEYVSTWIIQIQKQNVITKDSSFLNFLPIVDDLLSILYIQQSLEVLTSLSYGLHQKEKQMDRDHEVSVRIQNF